MAACQDHLTPQLGGHCSARRACFSFPWSRRSSYARERPRPARGFACGGLAEPCITARCHSSQVSVKRASPVPRIAGGARPSVVEACVLAALLATKCAHHCGRDGGSSVPSCGAALLLARLGSRPSPRIPDTVYLRQMPPRCAAMHRSRRVWRRRPGHQPAERECGLGHTPRGDDFLDHDTDKIKATQHTACSGLKQSACH